jgi:hypothetical protein
MADDTEVAVMAVVVDAVWWRWWSCKPWKCCLWKASGC